MGDCSQIKTNLESGHLAHAARYSSKPSSGELLSEYVRYHHEDRTHLGLEKGTPDGRIRSVGRVLSQLRLGGLHHRYNRAA